MKNIHSLINEISDNSTIDLNEIPHIDLYMDQVIQLFDNSLNKFKRTEEEKILTKTMINNYVKGKLLMPVNKKKYSKNHIILISLIYELKAILSISDIQSILEPMVEDLENNEEIFDLKQCYMNIEEFKKEIASDFKNEMIKYEEMVERKNNLEYENQLTLSVLLSTKANMYKRLSEGIVDNLNKEKNVKK